MPNKVPKYSEVRTKYFVREQNNPIRNKKGRYNRAQTAERISKCNHIPQLRVA